MTKGLSRAELLRGRLSNRAPVIRPPFAHPESTFRTLCNSCDGCVEACGTKVIGKDRHGYPELRFGQAHCTFCGDCAQACPTGALEAGQYQNWNVRAHIKDTCLSLNAITCRACEEGCPEGAIGFRLMTGGRAQPLVSEAACTGCGNCAVICPNQSVDIQSLKAKEDAA